MNHINAHSMEALQQMLTSGFVNGKAIAQAEEYQNQVSRDPYPCKYGHLECAAWNKGPCIDEIMSTIEADKS